MFKKTIISSFVMIAFGAQAETFVGMEGGYGLVDTNARATAQTIANAAGQTVSYVSDRGLFTGRLFISYDLNPAVAIEVGGFTTTSATNTYTLSGASAIENFSASGLDASAVFKMAETGLFGKAGFHYSRASADASVRIGTTTYSAAGSLSGSGLVAGVGYQAKLSEDTFWRTSYTYYNNIGGISSANVNLFSVGILKKF